MASPTTTPPRYAALIGLLTVLGLCAIVTAFITLGQSNSAASTSPTTEQSTSSETLTSADLSVIRMALQTYEKAKMGIGDYAAADLAHAASVKVENNRKQPASFEPLTLADLEAIQAALPIYEQAMTDRGNPTAANLARAVSTKVKSLSSSGKSS